MDTCKLFFLDRKIRETLALEDPWRKENSPENFIQQLIIFKYIGLGPWYGKTIDMWKKNNRRKRLGSPFF